VDNWRNSVRVIGMDIHRSFAQVAILEDGQIIRELRVDLVYGPLVNFAKTLSLDDEVVIEATGNSAAVERLMRPYVKRVAVANSRLVRAIAYARVKTDKIDAAVLARLHAAGFLPEVWVADEETLNRRRQIAERMGVLEQLVRLKGRIQAILHSNLIPKYSGHLFGKTGRKWLDSLPLPDEERAMLGRLVVELERVSAQMAELDKVLAQQAVARRSGWFRIASHPNCRATAGPRRSTSPAFDDHSQDKLGRRIHGAGVDRRCVALPVGEQAEQLLRTHPQGAPIRESTCASWAHLQAGQWRCPQDACGGSLVGEDRAWSASGVFCPNSK
jgi:transposase